MSSFSVWVGRTIWIVEQLICPYDAIGFFLLIYDMKNGLRISEARE